MTQKIKRCGQIIAPSPNYDDKVRPVQLLGTTRGSISNAICAWVGRRQANKAMASFLSDLEDAINGRRRALYDEAKAGLSETREQIDDVARAVDKLTEAIDRSGGWARSLLFEGVDLEKLLSALFAIRSNAPPGKQELADIKKLSDPFSRYFIAEIYQLMSSTFEGAPVRGRRTAFKYLCREVVPYVYWDPSRQPHGPEALKENELASVINRSFKVKISKNADGSLTEYSEPE